MSKRIALTVASISLVLASSTFGLAQEETPNGETEMTQAAPQTGYASVNGLNMYYEIHGTGEPLVFLHGAYMNIPTMGELLPRLAQTRQVIAVELQGHGRTADIADRPITYEQMADDVAALLGVLGITKADVFGYSMGGSTALQVAIRHPELVDKLVIVAATFNHAGWDPALRGFIATITPALFAGSPIETEYMRLSPHPENFATLVSKLVTLDTTTEHDWSPESIRAITSPALIIIGDSDAVMLEHAVEMFRLFGGGVNADFTGLPDSQLAIIPGAAHTGVITYVDLLTPMITSFLDAPVTQAQ